MTQDEPIETPPSSEISFHNDDETEEVVFSFWSLRHPETTLAKEYR